MYLNTYTCIHIYVFKYTHIYTHTYIYIYICICVCSCKCIYLNWSHETHPPGGLSFLCGCQTKSLGEEDRSSSYGLFIWKQPTQENPPGGGVLSIKKCVHAHTHTHTHTNSTCKYIKLTYTHIRKQRTMLPSHQHILFVTHSNIRPLLPFRAVHAICLYECRRTARIHELAEASHKYIFEPHSSTLAVANHTAPPTYVIDKNMWIGKLEFSVSSCLYVYTESWIYLNLYVFTHKPMYVCECVYRCIYVYIYICICI